MCAWPPGLSLPPDQPHYLCSPKPNSALRNWRPPSSKDKGTLKSVLQSHPSHRWAYSPSRRLSFPGQGRYHTLYWWLRHSFHHFRTRRPCFVPRIYKTTGFWVYFHSCLSSAPLLQPLPSALLPSAHLRAPFCPHLRQQQASPPPAAAYSCRDLKTSRSPLKPPIVTRHPCCPAQPLRAR